MSDKSTVGAVLVVGGGVAGMQSALDLADSGYKVYLAEKESSIGGTMAQLDKTFPSNDCAMCILAPRLVSVGRHLNIEILTNTELTALGGEAGNFQAQLLRRTSYIDPNRCTGCGECTEACPVELPSEFNLGLNGRKAIAKRYPQAVPAQFAISKRERPPCQAACTAGTNVQAYVALTAQGKFAEALGVVRERMPFASVCGRICLHRCEQQCNRNAVDQPLAIMHLKRFLADWDFEHQPPFPAPVEKTRQERVAVIGGGPAGLACAHDLAKLGYPVTLFESAAKLGGMLRACVPQFRLPEAYLDRDIEYLLWPGFEVRTNAALGRDFTLEQLEAEGYRAVFLATGAHKPKRLPIPGHDLEGISFNIDFLQKARDGEPADLNGRLLVIGGGNVAMDVARTARRLGAGKVTMACLESRQTMPAHAWEVQQALDEGIEIVNDVTFKRFLGENGRVTGVEAKRIRSMAFDKDGRLTLDEIAGSDFVIAADRAVVAIGQTPDLSFLDPKNQIRVRRGMVEVDPETLATGDPGVFAGGDAMAGEPPLRIFAGGDVVTGTAFVVDAVAAGHKAAESIHRSLEGTPWPEPAAQPEPPKLTREEAQRKLRQGEIERQPRVTISERGAAERLQDFDEIELGYTAEMAIAEASRCLNCGLCSECLQCVAACQAHAINHLLPRQEHRNLNVGAVILAPGAEMFNAESKPEYGFKRFPNVVTSLQFERILSPSGPFGGKVRRPSDQQAPRKVAFLQCVGSREAGRNYCSSVCCMYTAKQAVIAKEHQPGLDCTVFYIDLRAVSKGFEQYIARAKAEDVHYIRCRPSAIREIPGSHNLIVEYADPAGAPQHAVFDMVVLAVGYSAEKTRKLAESIGIQVDENGFCRTPSFSPSHTSRPGVFVSGPFAEPMDIPETVAAASASAAHAMSLLADSRGTLVRPKQYPPERDVSAEEPRVGVFVCHCGTNIAGVVDVERVVQYARTIPGVAYAERNLYTCSDDTQKRIREKIAELGLNRVIVASCTPRTHEALFRDTIREAGLNQYYFELANIRDQCSWVHMREPEKATRKAMDLVRMAVAKVRLDTALYKRPLAVTQAALVLGGGPAGVVAALELADQGFPVVLAERNKELGGHARDQRYLLGAEENSRVGLSQLLARAHSHPKIKVLLRTRLKDFAGSLGNFHSTLVQDGVEQQFSHGVLIVATGAERYRPAEYLYGDDPRVILNYDVEGRIAAGELRTDSVVFIQCVGSRCAERTYCSRTCCTDTVKNAIRIKELNPASQVSVLYRDIRTYGLRERFYRRARELGVRFIRYADDQTPQVAAHNGRLAVAAEDQLTLRRIELEADTVVLASATIPNPENKELAQILKVPLGEEGFFLEAHRKLRPVDFASDGIFLCGAAQAPMDLRGALSQAAGTAARAATVLARDTIELEPSVSHVVEDNCDGCAYCVDPCPYHALRLVEYDTNGTIKKRVEVDEAVCKGCGTCQATCPKNAIFVWHFRPEQLTAQIHAALNV
jgi:heterodisulfide reductase subunit A-like polyferredoxin